MWPLHRKAEGKFLVQNEIVQNAEIKECTATWSFLITLYPVGKERQISRTMRERKYYHIFSFNPAHFVLNLVGPRPAVKVRNEWRWRFCSAPML